MKTGNCKYMIVAGCSRLGASIAAHMSGEGVKVVIIDKNEQSFERLSSEFTGFNLLGDASDIDELTRAGIEQADLVFAALDNDNINIMVSQIAKKIFNVPRVITRLEDKEKEVLLRSCEIQVLNPLEISVKEFGDLLSIIE